MHHEKDPVCGMTVDSDSPPAQSSHEGHTHYFCSESCKQRFESNPTGYGDNHNTSTARGAETEQRE